MNFMHKVIINGRETVAKNGVKLSDLLISEGFSAEHPCGGKGVCKKCNVLVNGKSELSCQYVINEDITVEFSQNDGVFCETGVKEHGTRSENLCLVLDLGTTTLALALISLDTAKTVKVVTADNPQRRFGADIMTRIDYCTKNSVFPVQRVLIERINELIAQLNAEGTDKMFVSGNVTMLHLLFGVDPSSIGAAPYTPTFLESKTEKGENLGLTGIKTVVCLPSVSSFVGADIVAGLNLLGMPDGDKFNLLIDLGTNAEVVLYSKEKALCTAAAAGPCFEGANISSGMSAVSGAVYSFKDGKPLTVSGASPKGICGTGLVDAMAHLIKTGKIDETGLMEEGLFSVAEAVTLTQGDVRQFQLAKSAVYSAVLCLINQMGITFGDIDKMFISGGFSAKLDIENAALTGLLPNELKNKCEAVSNSSLKGTIKFATEQNDLSRYLKIAQYVDLSADPLFTDLFTQNMLF
ncbi:MAG: DUF4445 domain-containing protein [Ruminococcaceae bacterium]|nr:DUF4445 domain-containing protein [Oscillospiraceae bacterium]